MVAVMSFLVLVHVLAVMSFLLLVLVHVLVLAVMSFLVLVLFCTCVISLPCSVFSTFVFCTCMYAEVSSVLVKRPVITPLCTHVLN